MEDRLEYIEPEKKIISRVSGGGLIVRVEAIFNSFDRETELVMIWDGTGNNLFLKLLLPFLKGTIKNRAQYELYKFKNLVEEYGVKFK